MGACEIVVEKDLLKGVTERYRPNIRMTVLRQISADRLPDAIQKNRTDFREVLPYHLITFAASSHQRSTHAP